MKVPYTEGKQLSHLMTDYERADDWADALAAKIIKADPDPSSIELAAHFRRVSERSRADALAEALDAVRKSAWRHEGGDAYSQAMDKVARKASHEAVRAISALTTSDRVSVPRDLLIEAIVIGEVAVNDSAMRRFDPSRPSQSFLCFRAFYCRGRSGHIRTLSARRTHKSRHSEEAA